MPKTLFLSQEMHAERWEWGCEGRPLFHTGNSGRIEWRCVACVTLARSQSRGTGSGRGSWEDYKPSSVSLYQTTIRYFIQMAGEHKPAADRELGGICRSAALLHPYHSAAFTGSNGAVALWFRVWTAYFSPHSVSETTQLELQLNMACTCKAHSGRRVDDLAKIKDQDLLKCSQDPPSSFYQPIFLSTQIRNVKTLFFCNDPSIVVIEHAQRYVHNRRQMFYNFNNKTKSVHSFLKNESSGSDAAVSFSLCLSEVNTLGCHSVPRLQLLYTSSKGSSRKGKYSSKVPPNM